MKERHPKGLKVKPLRDFWSLPEVSLFISHPMEPCISQLKVGARVPDVSRQLVAEGVGDGIELASPKPSL